MKSRRQHRQVCRSFLQYFTLVFVSVCIICVFSVWGASFVCVTLINLCALLGMVFIPLMKKSFYKRLLMFMVALGAGTLTGSSLLFLLPEVCVDIDERYSTNYSSIRCIVDVVNDAFSVLKWRTSLANITTLTSGR